MSGVGKRTEIYLLTSMVDDESFTERTYFSKEAAEKGIDWRHLREELVDRFGRKHHYKLERFILETEKE